MDCQSLSQISVIKKLYSSIGYKFAKKLGLLVSEARLVELFVNDDSNGIYIEKERLNESFLRRNKISKIDEKIIISLDKFLELVHIGNHFKMVLPIESVLDDIPAVYLNKVDTKKFRNGQMLNIFESSSKINKLLVLDKEVVGIGKIEEGTLVPIRMFNI